MDNESKIMKIQNFLNGGNTVRTADKSYSIININSLKKSEDGYFRYIYYIYDHKTNKYYIGQHRTFSIEMDDYAGSGTKILNEYENAKAELGNEWESRFTKCIIANALSEEELEYLEKKIISKKVLSDVMSYNMIVGGKTGYKASNSIVVYAYNQDGNFIEKFKSINQAANWAAKNANTKGSLMNITSSIAKVIKNEKYKIYGLYFTDYEIGDWNAFIENLKYGRKKTKVPKNSPVILIDARDKSQNMFKNRKEAAEWVISNHFSNTDSIKQVIKSINRALQEERCAYGFIVRYVNTHSEKSVKMGTALFKSNSQISTLVGLINKYNSIFDFGKEKFVIELDERTFELMLSSVTMYNIQHNMLTDVDENRSRFSFMGIYFRKTPDKSRIVIEDCFNFGSNSPIPVETEEELCELCSSISSLNGITIMSSSSGQYVENCSHAGIFNILFKCSNMKSVERLMNSTALYDKRHSNDEHPSRTRYEMIGKEMFADDGIQMDEHVFRLSNPSFNTMPRIERLKRYSEIVELLK